VKSTKQLAAAFALTTLFVIPSPAQEPVPTEAGRQEIPQEDRAELIRLTLERALIAKKIPDYNIIEKQEVFYLSTENVPPGLVPTIEGVALVMLEPEEIKKLANGRGDYVYYFKFKEFKFDGPKVIVSLDNIPMYADKPARMAFGGGFVIEYI